MIGHTATLPVGSVCVAASTSDLFDARGGRVFAVDEWMRGSCTRQSTQARTVHWLRGAANQTLAWAAKPL